MSAAMPIACLPWYALPETEPAQDALWAVVAHHLRRAGIEAPDTLTRGVAIPGVFCDPDLLVGQCCGYDIVYGFAASLRPLLTPCYAAPGCDGPDYRSFVLVRDDHPAGSLEELRGARCAINSFNSHSGTNALRALVARLARDGRFFASVTVTGAHLRSLDLVRSGDPWRDSRMDKTQDLGQTVGTRRLPKLSHYPTEVIGQARVVDVRPKTATLYVTESTTDMPLGVRAEMRAGQ